jgi:hypothetical protein
MINNRRINRLHDLQVDEVSLVPRGANRKKFLILKSMLGGDAMDQSMIERILDADLEDEERVDAVLKAQGLSDKARNAVKGALRILNAFKDELPNDILNTLASLAGYGYAPAPTGEIKAAKPYSDDDSYGDYGYGEYGEGTARKKPKPKRSEDAVAQSEPVRKSLLGLARDRDEVWASIEKAAELMYGECSPRTVDMLLCTRLGAELYSQYLSAPLPPSPRPVSKASDNDELDSDVEAWREIQALAQQLVQKSGDYMTEAQAVAHILNTPRGKQLYKLYLAQKQQLIASRRR